MSKGKKQSEQPKQSANDNADVVLPEGTEYAGFASRVLATTIDCLLSILLLAPLYPIIKKLFITAVPPMEVISKMSKGDYVTEQEMLAVKEYLHDYLMHASVETTIIAAIVVLFWVIKSATPGKMLLKMKILDAKTLEPINASQSLIRYVGYFVSLLPLGLGFIWISYSDKKQGWHDIMASTVVIRKKQF